MSFRVLPAIDVREGRVVRLAQGDYARETRYPADALSLAKRYEEDGAQWLHLVDLDAARAGGYTLLGLLRSLRAETGLQVQTGGGVRTEADVDALLAAGATRVVVGSVAVREPGRVARWLREYGAERLTLALDTRWEDGAWRLPVHGWTQASPHTLESIVDAFADARHVLCTDIARDGMLAGPNLALYGRLRALAPHWRVQASGGVRDAADVLAAREAGCAGAVLGRALLEGKLLLRDALASEAVPC